MLKKIIFDCDNTMGVPGSDVDDGMALIYLLGKTDAEICGVTTTYGNSDVKTVYDNTHRILQEIGRTDIPLFKGCPDRASHSSEAVDYLVKTVNADPGNIFILATGSLTNLYAAYLQDRSFFEKTAEIVIMGGITEPLVINGSILDELNFSCDPEAAKVLLEKGKNISVVTGNNCLNAFFSREEFTRRLVGSKKPSAKYLIDNCMYWFTHIMGVFETDGFYNWDVVAAAYLMVPELFTDHMKPMKLDMTNLHRGFLQADETKNAQNALCNCLSTVNLPEIANPKAFIEEIYTAWSSFDLN